MIKRYFNTSLRDFLTLNEPTGLRVKYENAIFLSSLCLVLICVFLLNIQGNQLALNVKKMIFMCFPALLLMRSVLLRSLNLWYVALSVIVLIYGLYFGRIDAIADYVIISWCYLICLLKPKFKFPVIFYYGLSIFLCTIIGASLSLFEVMDRPSLGGLDPNYSSLIIFLILPVAISQKSAILSIAISVLGLITQSRAFLLAILVYLIITLVDRFIFKINLSFKWFCSLFSGLMLSVIFFSYYALLHIDYVRDTRGLKRFLMIFNNESDAVRWMANTEFLKVFFSDWNFFLTGRSPTDYFENIFLFMPHNLPLLSLASYGIIVGSIFLFFWAIIIRKNFERPYIPFFLSMIIYWLFLGVEVGAIYNAMMISFFILFRSEDVTV
jgi:hypothetical protein